jgi:hypothetical protein
MLFAMKKLRIVTLGTSLTRSRGRFATPADFPHTIAGRTHMYTRTPRTFGIHPSSKHHFLPVPKTRILRFAVHPAWSRAA